MLSLPSGSLQRFGRLSCLLFLCACSVETADSPQERDTQTKEMKAKLIGAWTCESQQTNTGQTLLIKSQDIYAEDGTLTSRGVLTTTLQGMEISVNMRSISAWQLTSNQRVTQTQTIDINDVKARGGLAGILSLDDLERSLRSEMKAAAARGESEHTTITELSDNRLVFVGAEATFETKCRR